MLARQRPNISIAQLDLEYLSDVNDANEGETAVDEDDEDEDDKTAFGRLVLPEGHKEMVLSLISQHFRNKVSQKGREEQVDIVRGKGNHHSFRLQESLLHCMSTSSDKSHQ